MKRWLSASTIVVLIIGLLATAPHPTRAAGGPTIYFLARQDDNSDGLFNNQDRLRLYGGVKGQAVAQLSADEENVLAFDLAPDQNHVAYVTNNTGKAVLQIVQVEPDQLASVDLPDLASVNQVRYFSDAIWIIGVNTAGLPVLAGVNPSQNKIIAEQAMRLNDTTITLNSTGQYALAYSPSGALAVYKLPAISPVQTGLTGYASSGPAWSPDTANFVMVTASKDNPAAHGITAVDVTKPAIVHVAMPDFSKQTRLGVAWSDYGHYLLYSGVDYDENGARTRSLSYLVDADNGSYTTLLDGENSLIPLSWSPGDKLLLAAELSGSAGGKVKPKFVVYLPPTAKNIPVGLVPQIQIASFKWNPDGSSIVLVGGSIALQESAVFVAKAPDFDATQPVFTSDDPALFTAIPYWSQASKQQLILVAGSGPGQDAEGKEKFVMGGVYSLDLSSGTLTKLSPDGLAIERIGALVR